MHHFIIGLEITKLSHKIIRALERELITSVDKNLSATTARILCYVTENSPHQDIFQKLGCYSPWVVQCVPTHRPPTTKPWQICQGFVFTKSF